MSIKICMVGCGSFAALGHGPAQRKYAALNRDVELAGCCDADENRAREYRVAVGYGRHYEDVEVMLAVERPDAVVLAVPPPVTCKVASSILERGIPLLLEKPPGVDLPELRRLILAAEKGRVGAQVAFNRRHMPVMRRAVEILRSDFGPSFDGRIIYEMERYDRWDPDFSTTAVHAVDGALMVSGSPFRAAEVRFQTQRSGDGEAASVSFEAECVSGARVSINIQPVSGRNRESVGIHGVGQSLSVTIPFSPSSGDEGRLEHWRGDRIVASFSDGDCDAVERLGVFGETKAFLDAVRSGAPFAPLLTDCGQQVALMDVFRRRQDGAVDLEAL
jgi:myo-inositol 2-dehydrogenase/D-chiro-inositol 1-dehydrogenase